MTKPKLSFWQIWNLSFGFLGVQIGYSLQNSNTSSIFESLGADVSHLSYFWLAAPLAGMIVQPIVGLFSDGTWTRWGRRIPYILGGSLISALALVLMPNCPKLLAFAPLAMGAFILLFMDLSFNVTMQPFRALVADMLDDSQKTQGYVVQTFLINLGAVVGAILPLVMTWLGVSDEVSFVGLMRNVPGVMVRLGVTQFFSWAALFLMWTYLKPAITGVVTDHATGEVLSAGATQTWVGVLNGTYPIPACIAALFLGRVAARYGNKPVYAACLLAGALGLAGLCLLHDQYALMLPMVGIGIAWAGILAMPYAILSRAVEPRRMGVYMGIFNFTITVPQIVIGLTGGAIVKYCFASDAADMLALAGVFMLLAAVSVFLVKEHKAQ
ncbi:MFS transporter [Alistipes sp.]|uniref:MFS transporter n=1 Tax=Alistipes sp. TaxID=1872444 RepID=UPI0023F24479|nr:MFS transporter [Alistipes sp.]